MSGGRILIFTASHLCRNPRVVKEATTLGAAGYEVTVLTASVSPRFAQLDQQLLGGLPFRCAALDQASPSITRFTQRAATWMARRLGRLGVESAQALGPAQALLHRARKFRADLTIVHTEIPLWAAQFLIRDGRRVAVDFEDWHSEDLLAADRSGRPLQLLRHAEEFALRRCAYASATSQSMADALSAAYHCPPPLVLRNSFPLSPRSRLDRDAPAAPPRLIWFSQTIGPGRGLEEFIAAWALTKHQSRIALLGDVRADFRDFLFARVPPERRNAVDFLPPVPPGELPDGLTHFDIGLALELATPRNRDVTITNKILQYLNAGLAVLATGTAGQREILAAAPAVGALISLDDRAGLVRQLDALLESPGRLRAMQTAARAAAEREFCWEHEAPKLLAAVEGALANPPPGISPRS
ncbi:MAG TPA: glycosyltransferase [Opitutus sp.]|nr:glycosyltransferase [Opitutus sp.]